MRSVSYAIVLTAFFLGRAACAQEVGMAPAVGVPAAKVPAVKEKKICRSLTPTGSFMATRVCNTAAAWRAFDEGNAAGATDFRRAMAMTSTNERKAAN